MNFLEHLKISDSWIATGIVYALLLGAVIAGIANAAKISRFTREVTGELRKASWPWESDPKIKGIKKYKELIDSTVVVLVATILLAGFVSLLDVILIRAVTLITGIGH